MVWGLVSALFPVLRVWGELLSLQLAWLDFCRSSPSPTCFCIFLSSSNLFLILNPFGPVKPFLGFIQAALVPSLQAVTKSLGKTFIQAVSASQVSCPFSSPAWNPISQRRGSSGKLFFLKTKPDVAFFLQFWPGSVPTGLVALGCKWILPRRMTFILMHYGQQQMKMISKRAGRNCNNLGIGGRSTKKYWANISSYGSSGLFVKICRIQYITSCEVGRRDHLFSFVRKHLHTLRLDWLTFPDPKINQQEKIEGCSYARSLEITASDPNILQPIFEAFSLLMVCALASAQRRWKGCSPAAQPVPFVLSPPFPPLCAVTRLTASREAWVITIWQHSKNRPPEHGKKIKILQSRLESWEMTKSFCTFQGKKKKIFHFSTKSQALTALWGLLQVLVLLQLCLPVILTNTFKLIPTLPTQKAELLETGVRECVINSAIIKKK